MRSYSQIVPTFWTRGSGKKLRGNHTAQLLALYFMTAPSSNMIGLYYLPLNTICSETGLTDVQVTEALPFLEEIVKYDFESEMVWMPEGAAHQIGETMHGNDKRRAVVQRELEMAGSHPYVSEFIDRYAKAYGFSDLIVASKREKSRSGVNKGHPGSQMPPVPVPVPDLVIDPDSDRVAAAKAEMESIKRIFTYWQKQMGHQTAKLDEKRINRIRARLREGFKPEDLAAAIRGAKKDDFLMGREKGSIKKFDGIHTIFRDAEKVEELITISGQQRGSVGQIFTQDPEIAKAKQAETATALERQRKKDLEYNAKMAESKQESVNSREDLLKLVK